MSNVCHVTLAAVLADNLANETGVNFLDAFEAVQIEFTKHEAEPVAITTTKEIWNEAKEQLTTHHPGDVRD